MNKKIVLAFVTAFLIVVAGCSSNAQQHDVFMSMMKQIDTYDSLETEIFVDQYMKENDRVEERQVKTLSNVALTRTPFSMHQTIQIDDGTGEENVHHEEVYITEEGMFLKNEEGWIRFPAEMHEMMIGSGDDIHTIIDFAVFGDVTDEMTIDETNDQYILRFSTKDRERHDDLMRIIAAASVAGQFQMEEYIAFDAVTVDRLRLELYVDKTSYDLHRYNLDLELQLDLDDLQLDMVQHTEAALKQMNEVQPVTIPETIVRDAVDLETMMEEEQEE